jgi:hypothetical protein
VHRQPDRAALNLDRPPDRLADPDDRVGREAVPAAVVELLDRADEPQRPLLDEIGEREPMVLALVALGDVDDEPQIGLDHALLGREVAALDGTGEPELVRGGEQRRARDAREEAREPVRGHAPHPASAG